MVVIRHALATQNNIGKNVSKIKNNKKTNITKKDSHVEETLGDQAQRLRIILCLVCCSLCRVGGEGGEESIRSDVGDNKKNVIIF